MKKTELKITDAMIRLLDSKKNKKITDNDIIRESGVSRSTFYSHFSTQNEVLHLIFKTIDKRISKEFEHIYYFPSEIRSPQILIDFLSENILSILYEYRYILRIMYSSNISNIWSKFLEDTYTKKIKIYLNTENDMHLKILIKYVLLVIEIWITDTNIEKNESFKKHFKYLCMSSIINISL